jgi:hypothetical protein
MRGLTFVVLTISLVLAQFCAASQQVSLVEQPGTVEAVRFGVSEIERALFDKGFIVERLNSEKKATSKIVIVIEKVGSKKAGSIKVPQKPESYGIGKFGRGKTTIHAAGFDTVGTMYAALEIADMVRMSKGSLADAITEKQASPYLEIRAVNQFIFSQALEDPNSWYFNEEFWQDYFAMLARTRHNVVDFHAAYHLETTFFPNIYPYFITVPGFEDAGASREQARAGGVSPEQAKTNLAMFNRIIRIAGNHGIKVAMMNYNAQTWCGKDARKIRGDELVKYIKEACKRFVTACPELWMYGFRIGESGEREDFFTRSYVAGLKESNTTINLYTRSWLATKEKITPIAEGFKGEFYIEPKYNGEQLGLPYHAITAPARWNSTYSYEAYTDWPRNYKILYQIRANGTHRIFHWGQYDFVKRCAATCNFGEGVGFTLEPITAYYRIANVYHEADETPRTYYKWATERDWMWYELWGRLGYDPTIPESFFKHLFEERFGDKWGTKLYEATQYSGGILPLVYSYHCMGPDHRHMAPEMEIGNNRNWGFSGGYKQRRNAGNLDDFISVNPLDPSAMVSIPEYVDLVLSAKPDGRLTPLQTADILDALAKSSQQALAPLSISRPNREGYTPIALARGAAYYSDRSFIVQDYPSSLEGALLIQTRNGDKGKSDLSWNFKLKRPATVYIAWDERGETRSWLADWTRTGETIKVSDHDAGSCALYRKSFGAGSVQLGTYGYSGNHGNYFVVVVPVKENNEPIVKSADEFDKIKMDIDALAELGRYYAEKIRAGVALQFFHKTNDITQLRRARDYDDLAISHWKQLAKIADTHYAPQLEQLRMFTHGKYQFTWTAEGENLANETAQLNALDREFYKKVRATNAPIIGHVPQSLLLHNGVVKLRTAVAEPSNRNRPKVKLHYRAGSSGEYTSVSMKRIRRHEYEASLKGISAGAMLNYYFTAIYRKRTVSHPAKAAAAPYVRMVMGENNAPLVTSLEHQADRKAGKLTVSTEAKDKSGISGVRLYYKPIPSNEKWLSTEMSRKGGNWETTVKLTPQGVMYYVQAVDEYGNASLYPHFLNETPYRVAPSWDASKQ